MFTPRPLYTLLGLLGLRVLEDHIIHLWVLQAHIITIDAAADLAMVCLVL